MYTMCCSLLLNSLPFRGPYIRLAVARVYYLISTVMRVLEALLKVVSNET
jgi:hypothetical protein